MSSSWYVCAANQKLNSFEQKATETEHKSHHKYQISNMPTTVEMLQNLRLTLSNHENTTALLPSANLSHIWPISHAKTNHSAKSLKAATNINQPPLTISLGLPAPSHDPRVQWYHHLWHSISGSRAINFNRLQRSSQHNQNSQNNAGGAALFLFLFKAQGQHPDKGNNLCFDIAAIVAQSPRDSNYPLNILPSPNAIAVAAVA